MYAYRTDRQSAGLVKEAAAENSKSDTTTNFDTCMSNLLGTLTAYYTETFLAQGTLQRKHDRTFMTSTLQPSWQNMRKGVLHILLRC